VFAAGAAVILALIFGLGTSTWLFLKEREARERAVAAEKQEKELRRQAETREMITQAAVLVNKGRFEEADGLMKRVSFSGPTVEGAAVLRSLGEWHVMGGRWKEAADRFATLLKIDELDGLDVSTLDGLGCGAVLMEAGELSGYEQFRQSAVAGQSLAGDVFADRTIKISLLRPLDERLRRALKPIADAAMKSLPAKSAPNEDVFQAAWMSLSLSLMEYRQGNYANAVELCRRCLDYPEHNAPRTATARVLMAMILQHQGRGDEAAAELQQGRDAIEAKFQNGLDRGTGVQGFWFDWVFARILAREADALIAKDSR
jgi:tetratricopeptide (TPR) repeat protein